MNIIYYRVVWVRIKIPTLILIQPHYETGSKHFPSLNLDPYSNPDLYSKSRHLYSRRAPDEAAGAQCDGALRGRDQRAPAAARAGPAQVSTVSFVMNKANPPALLHKKRKKNEKIGDEGVTSKSNTHDMLVLLSIFLGQTIAGSCSHKSRP